MAFTTINKSSNYFNTKIYTGNGGTQSITDLGFQPDLTWIKQRGGTTNNVLYDAVRGAYWTMQSNTTNSQTADDGLTAWNSGGWNMANVSTTNGNGLSYVGWNWLGANGTAANTAGSINSTVSVNTTSGFSIVSWTGTGSASTIGHGLNAVPKMYIVKNKSTGSTQWRVYHASLGATKFMCLDATQAVGTASSIFNNTEPTSSVFSVGTDDAANKSGDSLIAYCFAEKTGYSKFGSYKGSGNADGPFVYTGFKPAFIMTKQTNGADWWVINDTKRDTFNASTLGIRPNDSAAESSDSAWTKDILSNGFKQRTTNGGSNGSGNTYIYMAFAEAPLVGTNNIPATAR